MEEFGIGFKNIDWDGVGWIDLAQLKEKRRAVVNTVMNLP
jgi:hypothetical protein